MKTKKIFFSKLSGCEFLKFFITFPFPEKKIRKNSNWTYLVFPRIQAENPWKHKKKPTKRTTEPGKTSFSAPREIQTRKGKFVLWWGSFRGKRGKIITIRGRFAGSRDK